MAEKHVKSGSPKPIPRQKVREEIKIQNQDSLDRESPTQLVVHPECPVCLQPSIHPVKVPCGHIFCFLCVKGAANQSQRCALCRQAIPQSFFDCPTLLNDIESVTSNSTTERYAWFYEGRNGWWQYDERTNHEIEDGYRSKKRSFELLIAGYMYIIDLDNMSQMRRSDPSRRRRIKRDLVTAPKKGIAGLKLHKDEPEDEEDTASVDENDESSPTFNPYHAVKSSSESQSTANENTASSSREMFDRPMHQNLPVSSDSSPDMSVDQLNEDLESLSLADDQDALAVTRRRDQDTNDESDSEQVIEI